MKNIFLIDGASGTGKTDLIKYISDYNIKVAYIKKFTTRKIREYEKENAEKLDLVHISDEDFDKHNFEYKYNYGGYQYGFSKSQIENCLRKNDNVFIIIRNKNLIEELKRDYNYLNVVSVFIYTDRDLIVERLQKDKHKPEDIDFRIKRLGIAYKSYLKNPTFYDEILINSGSEDDYQRIIDNTFNKYEGSPSIEPNLIFVLMSFNTAYDEVFDEFVDAAKLVDSSLIVKRIDKQRGFYKITDEILKNISQARLLICDLTDERPNVYYELGYALGLNKKIIACARKDTKLHFDIKDFRVIPYTTTSQLRKEISEEIKEHLKTTNR